MTISTSHQLNLSKSKSEKDLNIHWSCSVSVRREISPVFLIRFLSFSKANKTPPWLFPAIPCHQSDHLFTQGPLLLLVSVKGQVSWSLKGNTLHRRLLRCKTPLSVTVPQSILGPSWRHSNRTEKPPLCAVHVLQNVPLHCSKCSIQIEGVVSVFGWRDLLFSFLVYVEYCIYICM